MFCSNGCQLRNVHRTRSGPGVCAGCGKVVAARDVAKFGVSCGCAKRHANSMNNANMAAGNCAVCGEWNEKRTTAGLGVKCGCARSLAMKIRPNQHGPGKCNCDAVCVHGL